MVSIPTQDISILDRIRMVFAFIGVVKDINRTDDVFKVSEKIPDQTIEPALIEAKKGRWAIASIEKQTLLSPDVQELAKLPVGTLGHEYAQFMIRRGLSPDFYPNITIETEAKYFRLHLYQTHDLWHVITGFKADGPGEIGLQGFYFTQVLLPLPLILIAAGLLNAVLHTPKEALPRIEQLAKGIQMGRAAEKLFGFPWAEHWNVPLSEVRKKLQITSDMTAVPGEMIEQKNAS